MSTNLRLELEALSKKYGLHIIEEVGYADSVFHLMSNTDITIYLLSHWDNRAQTH